MSDTFNLIYEQVKRIPKGKVATYGMIAEFAGNRRWSQIVGFALHSNPSQSEIPCHRVVNRYGDTAAAFKFGGNDEQKRLLESEGVFFLPDGRVDMKNCLWDGN